jgi:hypothetical protein
MRQLINIEETFTCRQKSTTPEQYQPGSKTSITGYEEVFTAVKNALQ